MNKLLAPFLKYLEEHKLIDFEPIRNRDFENNDNLFKDDYDPSKDQFLINARKIQKYAYLAKRFGLDFPYKHNRLIKGPFSESLSSDLIHIAKNSKELYDPIKSNLPESFQSQTFLNLVNGKDKTWLAVATSLITWNEKYDTKDKIIKVMENTSDYKSERTPKILDELESFGLVKIKIIV